MNKCKFFSRVFKSIVTRKAGCPNYPSAFQKDNNLRGILAVCLGLIVWLSAGPNAFAMDGCTAKTCHEGISDIVPMKLPMMQMIKTNGWRHGNADGCVICHGGNPKSKKKEKAHQGVPRSLEKTLGPKGFYPDPGYLQVADQTCGACHVGYARRLKLSLMNTEAGKIAGNMNTWGIEQVKDYKVPWANVAVSDPDGRTPSGASSRYNIYMADLAKRFPQKFPEKLEQLPLTNLDDIEQAPQLAVFNYQRKECQRCHVGVKGRKIRGEYRGLGCSACHMPYSTEGFYQGQDQSIDKNEPGHILRHRISGNQKTGGIPVKTCNACHNQGKRIGVSYEGLMETVVPSPFSKTGAPQPKIFGKYYRFISDDLHHRGNQSKKPDSKGGLLCQDCHTSFDVHGDGNLTGTTLACVEIECTDCHGNPQFFPWELPLGYGDEFGRSLEEESPRGVTSDLLMTNRQFGFVHEKKDGYLISARGNPLGNVVRDKTQVIVHSASGRDFLVPQLKNIQQDQKWEDPSAEIAMAVIEPHMEKLECYGCHAAWAAQCYGCHVKVDFSAKPNKNPEKDIDWVASANAWQKKGRIVDASLGVRPVTAPGEITQLPAYTRWEDPILGINGEGRVSPIVPGCQVVYTVIDKNGKVVAQNAMAQNRTEGLAVGQGMIPWALDMAPVQPHTIQRKARSCENCHANPKAAGFGIGPALLGKNNNQDRIVDLQNTGNGEYSSGLRQIQISGIARLTFDWSKVIDSKGRQMVTVGTHWPLSRAFNATERDVFLRIGTCVGCHQKMIDATFWKALSTPGSLGQNAHQDLLRQMAEKLRQSRNN